MLESERVVIQAPMSYTGSARRIWRVGPRWLVPLLVVAIAATWLVVTGWYLIFGVLLVPYRLIRRGSRKNKREQLRHREILQAVAQSPTLPTVAEPGSPLSSA